MGDVPPVVSILMTAFNRGLYIGDAIQSVINSTFRDFELIIVDDASSDNTVEIANEYAARDSRIFVYQNEKNLGDYPNRNRAAKLARGKYIKYLDSDDLIYPHGLFVMVDSMKRHPGAGFGLSAAETQKGPYPELILCRNAYIRNIYHQDLFGRSPGSSIINREYFWQVGGFSGAQYIGDLELWLVLARYKGLVLFPRDLIWSRDHENQQKKFDLNNPVEINSLHHKLRLNALRHEDCPLSKTESNNCIRHLKCKNVKYFLRLLLRPARWRMAFAYYRKVDIRWVDFFAPKSCK